MTTSTEELKDAEGRPMPDYTQYPDSALAEEMRYLCSQVERWAERIRQAGAASQNAKRRLNGVTYELERRGLISTERP